MYFRRFFSSLHHPLLDGVNWILCYCNCCGVEKEQLLSLLLDHPPEYPSHIRPISVQDFCRGTYYCDINITRSNVYALCYNMEVGENRVRVFYGTEKREKEKNSRYICSDRYANFARSRTGWASLRILTCSRTGDPACNLAKVRDLIPQKSQGVMQ